ncbi:MAG: nucleotidyltransferase family protein [Candidatus Omnitrophica bacterium]|nr:nucleotidyltransferase family protein [Candidatus Omnitrophota bacterium]
MKSVSIFHFIGDLVREKNISCILIGGFAVNYYKVSRQTADVDFLITSEDFEKIEDSLIKNGYEKVLKQEAFVQFKSIKSSMMDVDFMLVDRDTFTQFMKDANEFNIVGETFKLPSLYHLIALKLHSIKYNFKNRLVKDLPDIINLIRINNIDIAENKFKTMCLKYGTNEIYNRILEVVK